MNTLRQSINGFIEDQIVRITQFTYSSTKQCDDEGIFSWVGDEYVIAFSFTVFIENHYYRKQNPY